MIVFQGNVKRTRSLCSCFIPHLPLFLLNPTLVIIPVSSTLAFPSPVVSLSLFRDQGQDVGGENDACGREREGEAASELVLPAHAQGERRTCVVAHAYLDRPRNIQK